MTFKVGDVVTLNPDYYNPQGTVWFQIAPSELGYVVIAINANFVEVKWNNQKLNPKQAGYCWCYSADKLLLHTPTKPKRKL